MAGISAIQAIALAKAFGGGGSSPALFEYAYTYTVETSWESEQTGATMLQAILEGHYDSDSIAYFLMFRNNENTSAYRADAICVSHMESSSDSPLGWLNRNYFATATGLSSTARATEGTLVDVYIAKKTN